MFVVGYTDTLTMSVPLQALKPLCADFDGNNIYIAVVKTFELLENCKVYMATK
jgi:hypothetical protein